MYENFGTNRVIEPKHVLPTSAWRLDNKREITENEMRVDIKTIHLEGSSFRQICLEAQDDDDMIKEKIMDIVIRRGKLHNPVTDTGGLAYGVVSQIGEKYNNDKGFQEGEEVICNASMASLPLHINQIKSIDRHFNQIEIEGYAIVYDKIPMVRTPKGLPVNLLLYTFNESGTLYQVAKDCLGKSRFMVVGNNLMMNLLYGHAIRRVLGKEARIVCVLDKKSNIVLQGDKIKKLTENTFDQIHYVNILKPLEVLGTLSAEPLFDVSINCAEIPGAETLNILATKQGGTVVFSNLINNYNLALYITEATSRHLEIRIAEGYLPEYDEFDIEVVRELAPYFEDANITTIPGQSASYKSLKDLGIQKVLSEDFVGRSKSMAYVVDEIMSVAKYDCNVLITGDTGVGKEKVANLIMKNSNRNMQPFIKVNCASIAANLMESEFFGYEEGAFTGAKATGKKGYFELADDGIIFLDEVGELSLDMQSKLLRVIQDGEFFRVGGTKPIKTNVRVISATNRSLEDQVEKKEFRRDLYYRLNVFPIKVPTLAERIEDIEPLTRYFIKKYGDKFNVDVSIDEDAIRHLERHNWPGNIRELENIIQRLIINSKSEEITLMDVAREIHGNIFENSRMEIPEAVDESLDLVEAVAEVERQIIKNACKVHKSTRKAANAIGISQSQLIRKKNKYGI